MSRNHKRMAFRNLLHRGFASFLCLVMILGLLPGTALFSAAAEDDETEEEQEVEEVTENWATPYMEKLVDWGVMRGDIDGNLYPERTITRAEFVTMMNRAYGYDEVGGNPFVDVLTQDWYYDDIDIAYNVGYFLGSSSNTATPNGDLTREQATVLLARNMMLRGTSGETMGFSDSRELSEWSRGLVGAASDTGVISGYEDGSFRPQNNVTRGEVASMLTRAVGTLINEPGSRSLGSVYGNVTINSSEVSLRDTTIVGNLYLTGGIGLGDVLLENVNVYGQIVVAGAGESNSSQSSVVMRNVTANELIVDNISNQFVTVRAEGDTHIALTSVRTNAYVEDTTANGYGLSYIELDGEQGMRLQLAGNIKEVKNLTPFSSLEIVQGSAAKVTADEKATDSSIRIGSGARVDELDLDVGATVTGEGDIGSMNVGASGTDVSILPDNITVRPGITSNVAGTQMDNVTAAESSSDPRLLSGYPAVRSIAPNSATLVFSTNKAGTVYWAVSALADGSVNEDDLITNPAYGGNVFRSGRINAASSKTEYTAQVTGLTVDGWYYVSAMLVDARGNHSPLKVTAFSTPDNTTPAFTTGYPLMTKNTTKTAQVTVMTNKSCQLFYALLPNNAAAPTPQEFKAGAVSGNLGYGVIDVVKSNTQPINVNSVTLEELTGYSLYLWLNDYDNAKSSTVRRVNFTTPDETPPVVTDIMQTNATANSVDLSYTLNEQGTLYWAIVVEGNTTFMNYDLDSTEAKVKVESGYSALKKGSSSASKADTAIRLAITALNSKNTGTTSYDVYYIAKDKAGNYADKVGVINVRTLDVDAPTVTQRFTRYNDDRVNDPLADTDIELVFSESVQGGIDGKRVFVDLYNAIGAAVGPDAQNSARETFANALREHIKMYRCPTTGQPVQVVERTKENQDDANLDWTIDYRFATVRMEEGKMILTFPTYGEAGSALNLDSGATYYFRVEGIYDNALTPNAMGGRELPRFTTEIARVSLSMGSSQTLDGIPEGSDSNNKGNRIDFNFVVDPISVDRADGEMRWDMLIWTDMLMEYTLYRRFIDENNKPVDGDKGKWTKLNDEPFSMPMDSNGMLYKSYTTNFLRADEQRPDLDRLQGMEKMEFAVHIDSMGVDSNKNFNAWNYNVTFRISIMAGEWNTLLGLANGSALSDYNNGIDSGALIIGSPDPFERRIPFTDSEAPIIGDDWPNLTDLTDMGAKIDIMLDRPGSVHYILFPVTSMRMENGAELNNSTTELTEDRLQTVDSYATPVEVTGGSNTNGYEPGNNVRPKLGKIPRVGESEDGRYTPDKPAVNLVTNGTFTSTDVIKGSTERVIANTTTTIDMTGRLSPNTTYLLCLVTQGTSAVYSKDVLCYRFTTREAMRPELDLFVDGSDARVTMDRNTDLSYFLVRRGYESNVFKELFSRRTDTSWTSDDDGSKGASGLTGYFWEKITRDSSGGATAYQYSEKNGNLNFESTMPLTEMTVLDAMDIRCYDGGTYCGSVFDMYATTEAKNELASIIQGSRSSDSNGIVKNGSGSYRAGETLIECGDKMQALQEYVFICVGKSAQGSGYSFRAYYPMILNDSNPPMVRVVTVSGPRPVAGEDPRIGVFEEGATITVSFTEPLYVLDSSVLKALDNCRTNDEHKGEYSGYYAIGALSSTINGCSMRTVRTHAGDAIDQIVFTLTPGAENATILFNAPLVDQYGNGSQRFSDGGVLQINVNITPFASTGMNPETGLPETIYTFGTDVRIDKSWNGTQGAWKSIGES